MKQLIEQLQKIIAEKLKNLDFEITFIDKSSVDGYVECAFTMDGYKFRASFNKNGFICWHDYPSFEEPALEEEECKSLCDEIHKRWNAVYKERLAEEIKKKQDEFNSL